MSVPTAAPAAVRPFRIEVPDEELAELRRRTAAARWPSRELVEDRSQGVQLATIGELARYWTTDYDWRRCEARLNALPQFKTEIDGVDIHFVHVRSPHVGALPLIMTHGWPGSVIELLDVVGPLTDPTSYGGRAEDAFDLVLPSLPGYGFSAEPTQVGWDPGRVARAWAELMHRLGYTRYVAQGGDVGAAVTDAMGRQAPHGLLGIHVNLLALAIALKDQLPAETEQERAAHDALNTFTTDGFGYFLEQTTRPQTIGYSLLDSPVGLAAWMLDHDTDSYYKIARAFVDGEPVGNLTRDNIIDNIMLYWLTGTGASAARWYWEFGRFLAAAGAAGHAPPRPSRFQSASRRSPARSGLPPAAGSKRPTRASPTSMRSTEAATSPPGRSQSSSATRCGLCSAHCATELVVDAGARSSLTMEAVGATFNQDVASRGPCASLPPCAQTIRLSVPRPSRSRASTSSRYRATRQRRCRRSMPGLPRRHPEGAISSSSPSSR
jgi:epoxide hydrolase-like protein